MCIIKSYKVFLNEKREITSYVSNSGSNKYVDVILDKPTSPQSFSSALLLKKHYSDIEITQIAKSIGLKNTNKFTEMSRKSAIIFLISISNARFLSMSKKPLHCEYCNAGPLKIYKRHQKFSKRDGATADHKNPISKGADPFDTKNLVVCCYWCNSHKNDMSYNEWMEKKLWLHKREY